MNITENFEKYLLSIDDLNKEENKKLQMFYKSNKDKIESLINAKYIFLDEYCRKKIYDDKNEHFNINQCREKANLIWDAMKSEEKEEYQKLVDQEKNTLNQIMITNPNKINAYNLFIKDYLSNARDTNTTKTFVDAAKEWKEYNENFKNIYRQYSKLVREERTLIKNGLEILNKNEKNFELPWGPLKYYVKEKINKISPLELSENEDQIIKRCTEEWGTFSPEQTNKYISMFENEKNEYIEKKFEFVQQVKNKNRKPRTAFNLFTNFIEKTYTTKDYKKTEFFDFVYEKWNELSDEVKEKFIDQADKEKLELIEEFSNKLEKKKKDKTDLSQFVEINAKLIQQKHPKKTINEIYDHLSTEWSEMSDEEKYNFIDKNYQNKVFKSNKKLNIQIHLDQKKGKNKT